MSNRLLLLSVSILCCQSIALTTWSIAEKPSILEETAIFRFHRPSTAAAGDRANTISELGHFLLHETRSVAHDDSRCSYGQDDMQIFAVNYRSVKSAGYGNLYFS
ncbi:hypothetical protein BOTCAL_0152g00080 [Botryotinia calthae]|uniref:Uncharacterized protein n=1 Tax=Botryotinia calthae TaxID=38488 RepID=A0A4Y8D2A4_9HELO|nr:hypothetical protein BOTCAL_0152g00080 [Botryotinia calthae]